jgi:hypothetical protein
VSSIEPYRVEDTLRDSDWVLAMQEELNNFTRNEVCEREIGSNLFLIDFGG